MVSFAVQQPMKLQRIMSVLLQNIKMSFNVFIVSHMYV